MISAIDDEDAIMIVIDRKVPWLEELAWLVALLAELGHERAAAIIITREYLHSIVAAISDEQEASMMIEHQASRHVEHGTSIGFLLGADRELDSSITIKSIVFHLLLFNLSLSHNDKEMIQAPNCSNQRDEDMKLSLSLSLSHETRDTRDTKQASKQRATRSNKNQSMKEQRTAPPSLNHSLTRTSLFLIFIMILESSSLGLGIGIGIGVGIGIGKRS